MAHGQQTGRSIEIPLKDSSDEDYSATISLRNTLTVMWNVLVDWSNLNRKAYEVIESFVNKRLKVENDKNMKTECGVVNDLQFSSFLLDYSEKLTDIMEQFHKLAGNFGRNNEKLPAFGKLVQCKNIKIQIEDMLEICKEIDKMLGQELKCKGAILEDLSSLESNRDILTSCLASWIHEPFMRPSLLDSLNAIVLSF